MPASATGALFGVVFIVLCVALGGNAVLSIVHVMPRCRENCQVTDPP